MNSIRLRTAALVAVGMTALLVVGGAALMLVIRSALTAQFDKSLAARAEALRSLTRFDGTKVEMDFAGEAMPRFARPAGRGQASDSAEYFVAWVRDGHGWRVLERSESLGKHEWLAVSPDDQSPGARDVTLPGGIGGRAFVIEFAPSVERDEGDERGAAPAVAGGHDAPRPSSPPAPQARILVAMSRAPLDRTLAAVGWSIFAVGVALALASLLMVRWAVGRGLAPVNDLSRRVQALGPNSLDARFESAGLPTELRPIAEQLSALLARLEEAFARERRFTSAASHELRTPIAELRMLLEVASNKPRSGEEWSRTAETALSVLSRAQSLCETLLRLSRAETDRPAPDAEARTHIGPVLAEQAARAIAMHGGDARLVRIDADEALVARVESATLASIVGNLLDNALRHGDAAPDDPVIVSAHLVGDGVRIDITNPAPALTSDDLTHLFEPFWRKDASRHDQRGFGLGLPVARTLARASGGEIAVRHDSARAVKFSISFLLSDGRR